MPIEVTIGIAEQRLQLCKKQAEKSSLGGVSRIRSSVNRKEYLYEDQLVGQLTNLAGLMWLYGSVEGLQKYLLIRWIANKNPQSGDGGFDVAGGNIDFKGTLIRNADRDHYKYVLAVRPKERHPDWIYVLSLVSPQYDKVHLLGWLADSELPKETQANGIFEGAFIVPSSELHQLQNFRWEF